MQFDHDLKNTIITVRLKGESAKRYWPVMDAVLVKNPYINRSAIIHELLGLVPPTVITEDDVVFFRTGEKKKS